eukprot:CAMPEP_0118639484 /NCGR_PEP_ID=MMETSP0785-20121206/4246_1 /TAXON_ID=91992 /ORGANISM="Bolidomonas pacifica, Strain CCMP 1866" /LENGTH=379 /DNA_ID=CAMNT_0006530811 /DNA_START=42 /DNA_END=1178 /DNA_ORIENTATION=-
MHNVEVIEVRRSEEGESEFYVHYVGFDRRLDEWIPISRIDMDTVETSEEREKKEGEKEEGGRTRGNKRRLTDEHGHTTGHGHAGTTDPAVLQLEKEHEELTKVKNIGKIQMGKWEVDTWYYSPYPDEYCNVEKLYVCEYTLKYMKKVSTLVKHKKECTVTHPPGNEIYREGKVSVFEIDGADEPVYCQNLCLLAKLFLDHKTLYYDVNPFFFYVVTEVDQTGCHIVGYFSKEKHSAEGYNLACILTFPQYQRSGYGKFIISLSYEISKREGKSGSPEKPLSDLGKLSYRSYWQYVLFNLFQNRMNANQAIPNIDEISRITAIKSEDIISTLQSANMIEFWKGQHAIKVDGKKVKGFLKGIEKKNLRICKSECLTWTKEK